MEFALLKLYNVLLYASSQGQQARLRYEITTTPLYC
jgi:hypothetical protein